MYYLCGIGLIAHIIGILILILVMRSAKTVSVESVPAVVESIHEYTINGYRGKWLTLSTPNGTYCLDFSNGDTSIAVGAKFTLRVKVSRDDSGALCMNLMGWSRDDLHTILRQ